MSNDMDRALLGLDDEFDTSDVLAAYRTQARVLHPDAGGSDEQMVRLTDARDRLVASFDKPEVEAGFEPIFSDVEFDSDRDEVKLRFYLVPLVLFPLFVIFLMMLVGSALG